MVKKKYSINWEDDLPVSFEVDGVQYATLEDVPDEADRLRLEAMLDSSMDADFDAEFEKMNKETRQIDGASAEKIIVWVFSAVAAVMLVIAGISAFGTMQKLAREESAPGVVVDMVERSYEDSETDVVSYYYAPVLEFKTRGGQRMKVVLTEGSNPPSYEVGDEVTVLYEPDNPSDARIQSFGSSALMWVVPGITGVLGAVFLGAVLAVQRYLFTPSESQA